MNQDNRTARAPNLPPTTSEPCDGPSQKKDKLRHEPQGRSSRGKQPQWRDLDTLAAPRATLRLPDASINSSKQKGVHWHSQLKRDLGHLFGVMIPTYPELNDRQKMDVWKKSYECVLGLWKLIRLLEIQRMLTKCDVLYPKLIIGKPFPFHRAFGWLGKETMELDPVPYDGHGNAECDLSVTETDKEEAGRQDVMVVTTNGDDKVERSPGQGNSRKRPLGVKAAK
ncbi:hypothetical protein FGB62_65g311 [Gracilaria domingensis]|nr:hypothetical protein FGB62_65g311 [Gracilaria domingensis]